MPRLFRLLLVHNLIGFALSAAFLGVLLWFDVGGLAQRVATSSDGLFGAALIFAMNGLLFGAVQTSVAVFLMAERDDEPPARGRLQPVRVAVAAQGAKVHGKR